MCLYGKNLISYRVCLFSMTDMFAKKRLRVTYRSNNEGKSPTCVLNFNIFKTDV